MSQKIKWILPMILFALLFSGFQSPQENDLFLPPDDQIHLFIGQDLGSIGGLPEYNNGYIDYFGMPAGVTSYTDIRQLLGLKLPTNYGAGDIDMDPYLEDPNFDETMLAIGLYMVNQLEHVISGKYDKRIEQLADFIIAYENPVFLRIGYEFNWEGNHYDPELYKQAYIHIVQKLEQLEVENIVNVWQANEHGSVDALMQYYPGDEFVDWVGYSYFDSSPKIIGHGMLEIAREHNKPVFIAEATPRKDLFNGNQEKIWKNWFLPFFDHLEQNQDVIKAVSYINCQWWRQPMWQDQGWGDSRLQTTEFFSQKWQDELSSGRWNIITNNPSPPSYQPTDEDYR